MTDTEVKIWIATYSAAMGANNTPDIASFIATRAVEALRFQTDYYAREINQRISDERALAATKRSVV